MKIERVDGSRSIRVLLTHTDLNEMNINLRTLTSDSPELHSFLFKVMDFIKAETGFNATSGQIVVEASPADGGVMLTVTKVVPERKIKRIDPKKVRVRQKSPSRHVYRFYDFEAMTEYLADANRDYLSAMKLFEYRDTFFAISDCRDCTLSEFAQVLPPIGTDSLFLAEHGKLVAEGEAVLKMAEELKKLK